MTLQITIALVLCAAHGCSARSALEPQSKFELDCRARGGHVLTLDASQACVIDAGCHDDEPEDP